MAITAETRTDIIELVVGMVDAAPGAAILSELADVVDAGLSLEDLAIALADNAAFKALYPSFLTAEEFSTNFLTSLMGGNPGVVTQDNFDLAVDALVSLLNAGEHRGSVMYQAIVAISGVAEDDENFGAAAALLNNKTEVAEYYSVTTQQSADTLADLKAVIADVDETDASVTAAKADVDGTNNEGQTFVLTTAVDSVEGTAGNDTIIAVINEDENSQTLNLGDVIDGGAGEDTIEFTTDDDDAPFNVATITNVEHVIITDVDDDLNDIDLDNVAFDTVTINDLGGLGNIENILTSTNLTVVDLDADLDVNYSDSAGTDSINVEVSGTDGNENINIADIETINLTFSEGVLNDEFTGNLNLGDVDNLNITANADVTVNGTLDTEADAAIVITGSGDVEINQLEATEITVDATALTGDLTITAAANNVSITSGAGDDTVTTAEVELDVDLGAGDDTFDTNGLDYGGATAVDVEGGDGNDTIIINDGAHLDAAAVAHFNDFEILDVGAGTGTYDLDVYDFVDVVVSGNLAGDVTITNITDESVTVEADQNDNITLELDSATGTNTLELGIQGSSLYGTDGIDAGNLINNQAVEIVSIDSSQTIAVADLSGKTVENDINQLSVNAETLIITGNESLDINDILLGDAATENNVLETIDASASAGITMAAGSSVATADISIIGSDYDDILRVGDTDGNEDDDGDGAGSTINAGLGGDQIIYTDEGATDTIILDAGDSLLGYIDDNDSNTYTAAADRETFDVITGFVSGEDTIDLGSFGFSGQQASALAGPTVTAATLLALVDGTTDSIDDLFIDTGVQRGVAVVDGVNSTTIGGGATSTVVFIDSNGDGDFTVADDDVIVLADTATVALGDFGF